MKDYNQPTSLFIQACLGALNSNSLFRKYNHGVGYMYLPNGLGCLIYFLGESDKRRRERGRGQMITSRFPTPWPLKGILLFWVWFSVMSFNSRRWPRTVFVRSERIPTQSHMPGTLVVPLIIYDPRNPRSLFQKVSATIVKKRPRGRHGYDLRMVQVPPPPRTQSRDWTAWLLLTRVQLYSTTIKKNNKTPSVLDDTRRPGETDIWREIL